MPAHILLVEDNPTNLDLMAYLLEAFGHRVIRAHDGRAGLDLAASTNFDIILADILMPRMDGYEFVRLVKEQNSNGPPVIAVTALAMVGDRERVLQSGFDGYIAKPINPESFVHEVDVFLADGLRSIAPLRPQSPQPTPVATRPVGKPSAAITQTVLVVDDIATNIEVVRAAIESAGYNIVGVQSMRQALEAVNGRIPDLVIADVLMSNGSGFDLIRAFKSDRALAAVPFIFLTSSNWHDVDRSRGIALGAKRFLRRPIEPQLLLSEVKQLLECADG
jgi:two-component system cell cycle response regulator